MLPVLAHTLSSNSLSLTMWQLVRLLSSLACFLWLAVGGIVQVPAMFPPCPPTLAT